MKKVLLVTDVTFWEKSSGHRVRISALIKYLAVNVNLTIVITGPAPQNIEMILGANYKAEFFILEKAKYLNSNGYGRRLKTFLRDRHFDCIIIEYIHSSYFLNFLIEETLVILDAHDIISERTAQFKKYNQAGTLYELSETTETEMFNLYDYILVLCPADRDKVASMAGHSKALLCPHPVKALRHRVRPAVKNIGFIASGYLPNADAISWFIKHCWPDISGSYDVQLCIYGSVCDWLRLCDLHQVVLKGFVADIRRIYREVDIVINPVRFGAGLKIKNLEALAHGLPLVTTSHGSRGIENGKNEAYLLANTADEFIQAISSLIEDAGLRKRLRRNAHRYVNENLTADNCFGPLLEVINA
jgi:glycosyltransferase involved in cell wall biosynthesis